MKKLLGSFLIIGIAVALSAGVTGCTKPPADKDKKDKKDKDKKDKDKTEKPDEKQVELKAASEAEKIKAGEKKTVKLTITRGKEAKAEVELKVDVTADKKVKASVDPAKLKDDKLESTLTIEVEKDAKAGEVTVTVKSTSEGSKESTATVKVTVEAAGAAVVDPPAKDYALEVKADKDEVTAKKDDKSVKVAFKAKLGADQKVTWTAGAKEKDGKEDAKKVTVKAEGAADKSGDVTATVTLDGAAPGEYWIWLTAKGEGKKEETAKVKLTVDAK